MYRAVEPGERVGRRSQLRHIFGWCICSTPNLFATIPCSALQNMPSSIMTPDVEVIDLISFFLAGCKWPKTTINTWDSNSCHLRGLVGRFKMRDFKNQMWRETDTQNVKKECFSPPPEQQEPWKPVRLCGKHQGQSEAEGLRDRTRTRVSRGFYGKGKAG